MDCLDPAGRRPSVTDSTAARGPDTTGPAWPRRVGVACLAAMAAAALVLTGGSLRWPLIGDTAVMHYVAWRIHDGAAPYRDLFDMNFPGTYLVHLAGIWLFGHADAVVRGLDLAVLGLTLAGLAITLGRLGWMAPAAAGLIFWLYHLTGGPASALQRDYLQCLPLAWMTASAALYSRGGRIRWLALGGASIGAAASVKPLSIVLLPVFAGLAWSGSRVGRWTRLGAIMAGVMASMGAALTWVWTAGGMDAFADIVWRYLPLYADFDRAPILTILFRPAVVALTPWAAMGALLLWGARRVDHVTIFLAAGVGFAVGSLLVQGKSFGYHGYPFVLFAGTLGAAGLPLALGRKHWAVAFVGLLLVTSIGLGWRGIRYADRGAAAEDRARVTTLAALVQPTLAQGRSVQMLDDVIGGLHTLYRLRAPHATRFLYDFHFFHHVSTPYIQNLRRQLLDELRASRPGVVVLFRHGQPVGGFDRLEGFPELADWLADGYQLTRREDVFRVYVARDLHTRLVE